MVEPLLQSIVESILNEGHNLTGLRIIQLIKQYQIT